MPQVVTNSQITGLTPGNDFQLIRTYPLDQNVTITTAKLAIKSRINSPNSPNGAKTTTPIFLTINTSASSGGVITDTGVDSEQVVLTFLLSATLTDATLDQATMYFFGIELEGVEDVGNAPQKYSPESGTIVTNSRYIYNS